MKYKNRLIAIICLLCFIKLISIANDGLMFSWPWKASQLTEEVIEVQRMEFNLSFQRDDFLDILEVPIQTEGPEVPRIILHNPFLCGQNSSTLNFLIYFHSYVNNWVKRQTLRSTYANPKLFKNVRFKVAFFVGLSKEIGLQQTIKKEFDEYGDIVQGEFIDTYKNMTLKAILAINWISRHCSQADYALKVDDDTLIDLFQMISLMQQNLDSSLVVICPVWPYQSVPVFRDKKDCMKWCVTFRQYRDSKYPRYCSGLSYILSRALIPRLVDAVVETPFFWIDDVYVTGLLMQNVTAYADVRFVTILDQMELDKETALTALANMSMPITKHLWHTNSTEMFVNMWQLLLNRLTKEQRKMIHLSAAISSLKAILNVPGTR